MSLGNWEGAFKDEAESGDLPYMWFKYIFRVRRMCFFCCLFIVNYFKNIVFDKQRFNLCKRIYNLANCYDKSNQERLWIRKNTKI